MKATAIRLEEPLLLVAGFLFLILFTARAPFSWGEASRLATLEALVERGTPVLDGGSFPGQADKLRATDGMVSHKPPGMQIALVPAYWLLGKLGFTLERTPRVIYTILTLLACGTAWLLCGYALHRRHRSMGILRGSSLLLVGSLLFGSLMLPYGLALNAHLPAGVLLLLGLLLLTGEQERYDHFLAGVFLGTAFAFDHAALLFIVPALLFRTLHKWSGMPAVAAGILPGVLLSSGWYFVLGDSWLPLVFQPDRFDYPYSPWLLMSLTGGAQVRGVLDYLYQLLLGPSGLFLNHPVLLFPLAGLVALWRRERDWAAAAVLTGLVLLVGYYGLNSRNLGGDCFGIRWFALAVPPLGLGLPPVAAWLRRRAVAAGFLILLIPSVAFAGVGAAQPWMKFHLSNPDPLRADKPFFEHLEDEFRRRSAPPKRFTTDELIRFYRLNLRRLAAVTRRQAEAGGGRQAFSQAVEKTTRMLRNTPAEPVLWEVHAELLEGAGRLTEAADARAQAATLRGDGGDH